MRISLNKIEISILCLHGLTPVTVIVRLKLTMVMKHFVEPLLAISRSSYYGDPTANLVLIGRRYDCMTCLPSRGHSRIGYRTFGERACGNKTEPKGEGTDISKQYGIRA